MCLRWDSPPGSRFAGRDQLQAIPRHWPTRATSSSSPPSRHATPPPTGLMSEAVQQPEYAPLFAAPVAAKKARRATIIEDEVLGCRRLRPGDPQSRIARRVSSRSRCQAVFRHARLAHARRLIELYERAGIGRERVLVESPPPGRASRRPRRNTNCNLSAGVFSRRWLAARPLISPSSVASTTGARRPPVPPGTKPRWRGRTTRACSRCGTLQALRHRHRSHGCELSGNVGQIQALAGCDLLTVGPS